jgi:Na+/melibiose symporter-like transporter
MGSKPDQQLVYIYSKRQFKRRMWMFFFIWLALRIARAVMYFTVGVTYLASIPAIFIFFGSGAIIGCAILSVIIYRHSSTPEPGVELEEEPLN